MIFVKHAKILLPTEEKEASSPPEEERCKEKTQMLNHPNIMNGYYLLCGVYPRCGQL